MSSLQVFENYSKKPDDTSGLSKIADSKRRLKIPKKGLGKKQKLTANSQPELLFLEFDPKKSRSQIFNSENSTNINYEVCTQPDQKLELRAGKKSWHPPTRLGFNNIKKEIKDDNFISINSSNLKITENSIKYKQEYTETFTSHVQANENIQVTETPDCIDRDNLEVTENNILEQNPSDEESKCLTDVKSEKQTDFEENNNLFSSMDAQEIDELIDKNTETYLSEGCETESEKAQCIIQDQGESVQSGKIITPDSDDDFKITTNEIDEIYRFGENGKENKLLQEGEMLLENSSSGSRLLIKDSKEFSKAEEAANETEIFDDKEENEFDLTDSQFLEIERDYSKSKGPGIYSDRSTQTMPIHEVHDSVQNVPQMMGGLRNLKNNIQKIRQCIQELKKIDTVLLQARKDICLQRNMPNSWNSPNVKNHLPPLL